MESDVRVVKLVTGEELIVTVVDEDDNSITVCDVAQFFPIEVGQADIIAHMHYCKFSKISINNHAVVYDFNLEDEYVLNHYKTLWDAIKEKEKGESSIIQKPFIN